MCHKIIYLFMLYKHEIKFCLFLIIFALIFNLRYYCKKLFTISLYLFIRWKLIVKDNQIVSRKKIISSQNVQHFNWLWTFLYRRPIFLLNIFIFRFQLFMLIFRFNIVLKLVKTDSKSSLLCHPHQSFTSSITSHKHLLNTSKNTLNIVSDTDFLNLVLY